ncbi:DUF1840 domain-containing protein [Massilia sp. W12]|uniref:DUF1840 domain-containing protein n=1 Tax=Massilia sp. W12 TaxID=3126507 RepID=UPI0030CCAE73
MLITFKSKAAPEVLMYQEHANRILDLWRKEHPRGVLTVDELPQAIARLQAEIEDSKQHPASEEVQHDVARHHNATTDDDEHEPAQEVSFATRAFPLMEMLRAAEREKHDIVWGV